MNKAFVDVPYMALVVIIQNHCTNIILKLVLAIVEGILTSIGVMTLIFRHISIWLKERFAKEPSQLATIVASTPSQITSPRGSNLMGFADVANRTASGQDANAGAVGAIRYLGSGMPELFPYLDPNLRRYEYIFMSPLTKVLMTLAEIIPFVGICTVLYEGGSLAARATVMDEFMTKFLMEEERGKTAQPGLTGQTPSPTDNSPTSQTAQIGQTGPTSPTTKASNQINLPYSINSHYYHKQIIILGAGFDSRAYRLPAMKSDKIHIIEVDQSSVQEIKKQRLSNALSKEELNELTARVEFVACNFEHEGALYQALSNSETFDPHCQTFILWEGVTYYLPISAVESTLYTLRDLRQSGKWTLLFDFADEEAFNCPLRIAQRLNWALLSLFNHPCKSCMKFDNIEEFMGKFNIRVIQKYSTSEIISRYFPRLGITRNMLGLSLGLCEFV